MAEPQPSNVHEGMDPEDATHPAPTNAEDRKAAAALSSLDTRGEDDDAGKKLKKEDQDALGKAISRLEAGTGKGPEGSQVKKDQEKKEEEVKKKVKVDQKDVTLLVSHLSRRFCQEIESDPRVITGSRARVEQNQGYRAAEGP